MKSCSAVGACQLVSENVDLPPPGLPVLTPSAEGELFDLEKLAEECKQQKRWSFFFTSAPLHIRGGVGSPPNTIVIF